MDLSSCWPLKAFWAVASTTYVLPSGPFYCLRNDDVPQYDIPSIGAITVAWYLFMPELGV